MRCDKMLAKKFVFEKYVLPATRDLFSIFSANKAHDFI